MSTREKRQEAKNREKEGHDIDEKEAAPLRHLMKTWYVGSKHTRNG
jgi:hypothetical protein